MNYAVMKTGWFTDVGLALQTVALNFQAFDDCTYPEISSPSLSGDCQAAVVTMSATDACGNTATIGVPINLDTVNPTVTCGAGITSYNTNSKYMVNPQFSFNATDHCGRKLYSSFPSQKISRDIFWLAENLNIKQ